ncbi:MAG: hypothetical protein Q8K32_07075 [Archangium sp.]|nr:hypothetical protein [Archangium sp.]
MAERVVRKAFPREDGLIEDLLAVFLHNDTGTPIPVPARVFHYTDAEHVQAVALRQDATWIPHWARFDEPGSVRYELRPTITTLAPGGHHYMAIKVLRRGCLTEASNGEVTFQDPMLDLGVVGATRVEATVVFPERPMRTEVAAQGALTTSRTATWSASSRVTKCVATQRRARLPSAPRSLDRAVAELHGLFTAVLCREWLSLVEYARLIQTVHQANAFVPSDEDFRGLTWSEQIEWIEAQLSLCGGVRARSFSHPIGFGSGSESDLAEYICRSVETHAPQSQFLPDDLWETLESLARYLLEQRKLPNAWAAEPKEQHLHAHLGNFLSGRGHLEREVQSSRGRIDLLLGATPVELKCRPLGTKPNIEPHLQQAAAYATSRGCSLSCLVILDTSLPSRAHHEPHPTADVTVHPVKAAEASGAAPRTLVVVFVVRAQTTSPSGLTGIRAEKPRQKKKIGPNHSS